MTTPTDAFGNTRPSEVTATFFNRTNDPMDRPIPGTEDDLQDVSMIGIPPASRSLPSRKYEYNVGDHHLVDNTSVERPPGNFNWNEDRFGLLSTRWQQKLFDLIQKSLVQPRFNKIWQDWRARLPPDESEEAMLFESLKHVKFTKPIGVITTEELQKMCPEVDRRYEGIKLETDRPINLHLQVGPLYTFIPEDDGSEIRISRIVVQVGLTLVYHHVDVLGARGNTWKEVSIACGVYLDKTDTGMDDHFGRNATDVSDILSLASDASTTANSSSIPSSLPSNATDDPAERSCLSTILQSVAETSSPPSLLELITTRTRGTSA